MSRVKVITYKTHADRAAENAALVQAVYAELNDTQPVGLTYRTVRMDDGVTFVHIAMIDGDNNPLQTSPAFTAFQSEIADRCVEGPRAMDGDSLGYYSAKPG